MNLFESWTPFNHEPLSISINFNFFYILSIMKHFQSKHFVHCPIWATWKLTNSIQAPHSLVWFTISEWFSSSKEVLAVFLELVLGCESVFLALSCTSCSVMAGLEIPAFGQLSSSSGIILLAYLLLRPGNQLAIFLANGWMSFSS